MRSGGEIVAAGFRDAFGSFDFTVARYKRNGAHLITEGTLHNNAFSGDGKTVTDFAGRDAASAVIVQPDARIVAAGNTQNASLNQDFALARYLGD